MTNRWRKTNIVRWCRQLIFCQVLKEIEPVFNAAVRGILFPEELAHHETALVGCEG